MIKQKILLALLSIICIIITTFLIIHVLGQKEQELTKDDVIMKYFNNERLFKYIADTMNGNVESVFINYDKEKNEFYYNGELYNPESFLVLENKELSISINYALKVLGISSIRSLNTYNDKIKPHYTTEFRIKGEKNIFFIVFNLYNDENNEGDSDEYSKYLGDNWYFYCYSVVYDPY